MAEGIIHTIPGRIICDRLEVPPGIPGAPEYFRTVPINVHADTDGNPVSPDRVASRQYPQHPDLTVADCTRPQKCNVGPGKCIALDMLVSPVTDGGKNSRIPLYEVVRREVTLRRPDGSFVIVHETTEPEPIGWVMKTWE